MKAVIFDMDGVIVDTEPIHKKQILAFITEEKLNLSAEQYDSIIGTSNFWSVIEELNPQIDIKVAMEKLNIWGDDHKVDYPSIFRQSIPQFLKELRAAGYKIAVASSSPRSAIEEVLTSCNIYDYYDVIISGREVPNGKPAPDVFLKAAELLGVPASKCVVIEDSKNGVQAGVSAGMKVIGVRNASYAMDLSKAFMVVDDTVEIDVKLIESLQK
jgi:haloacid dehalogenase superfamily, subfamily IA, variant 3 with third motif having DD or ED/haloacid dehalogenase superfamily, subfamily IA, variant 1 with third motif having Dx(3-4)D or Dx(3-4)E